MKVLSILTHPTARPLLIVVLLLTAAFYRPSDSDLGLMHESASAQVPITVVNGASFDGSSNRALSPDTIASAFGAFVTENNQSFSATTVPLPARLGGVSLTVNNIPAGLFFASTGQLNFLVPSNIQDGIATIVVTNFDNTTRTGTFNVVRAAPGIFSRNSSGQGIAAALTTLDGITYTPVFNPDGSARDVSAGTRTQPTYLALYATGVRNTPATNPTDGNGVAESVTVTIQGVPTQVLFAGPAPGFMGLEQINVVIPPELSGINGSNSCLSEVRVALTTNNRRSNEVTFKIGGQQTPVNLSTIGFGEMKTGRLTNDDQLQFACNGSVYFFDAYEFTTTVPNTTIAIDMRSSQFDAGLLLYSQQNGLSQIGSDDDLGGLGDGGFDNTNSLLLFVVQTPGRYVIFATSSDVQPVGSGDYTLNIRTIDAPQLSFGQSVNNAAISSSDLQTSGGDFLDVYWFNGLNNDNVLIGMNSTAFDSLLILQSNDNSIFTFDDNGGGGQNALLNTRLNGGGIYLILATPFAPTFTGGYSLTLNRLASFGNLGVNLPNTPGRRMIPNRGATVKSGKGSLERANISRDVGLY